MRKVQVFLVACAISRSIQHDCVCSRLEKTTTRDGGIRMMTVPILQTSWKKLVNTGTISTKPDTPKQAGYSLIPAGMS